MIKERLKELDIKITELANYLSISRPTMYKFIEMYDAGSRKDLSSSICSMFDYIEQNELIDKKNVVNYILKHVVSLTESPLLNDDKKNRIIEYIDKNDNLDELFIYLITAVESSTKKRKTKKDETLVQTFKRINGIYLKAIKENK